MKIMNISTKKRAFGFSYESSITGIPMMNTNIILLVAIAIYLVSPSIVFMCLALYACHKVNRSALKFIHPMAMMKGKLSLYVQRPTEEIVLPYTSALVTVLYHV